MAEHLLCKCKAQIQTPVPPKQTNSPAASYAGVNNLLHNVASVHFVLTDFPGTPSYFSDY
jgi:hypothetical protein